MRSKKTFRRLAAICALAVAGMVAIVSPATADSSLDFLPLHSSADFKVSLLTMLFQNISHPGYSTLTTSAEFEMGSTFGTTATDCTADLWITLTVDGSSYWDSPHYTHTCKDVLPPNGNNGQYKDNFGPAFDTVAQLVDTHVCVTLWWGSTTHSLYGCVSNPTWVHTS